MKNIVVNVYVTKKLSREFELSDEQYRKLKEGYSLSKVVGQPFLDAVHEAGTSGKKYELDFDVEDKEGNLLCDYNLGINNF